MKKGGRIITHSLDPRIAYFDGLAEGWDADPAKIERTIARLEELRPRLALGSGQDLLEVGCGTGQVTAWLCSAVWPGRVVAIDFAPAMVARAQAKGIAAEFRVGDICRQPPERGAFDVAFCFHSFPHFRDPPAALANLRVSLKPGGRLIVMHLAGSETINAVHSGLGGAVGGDLLPSAEAWTEMLNSAGLTLHERIDRDDLFFLRAVTAAT